MHASCDRGESARACAGEDPVEDFASVPTTVFLEDRLSDTTTPGVSGARGTPGVEVIVTSDEVREPGWKITDGRGPGMMMAGEETRGTQA